MTTTPSSTAAAATHRLRPYQQDAIERVDALVRRGARRILLVLPTGGGKTVIAAHVLLRAVANQQRVLFLAHRRELIHQAYRRFVDVGLPERDVGVLMATDPRRRPTAAVQIASIDTLRNRPKPVADLVFVDEAHRALARSYAEVSARYPDAVHLGLTATPYRADGKGLGDAYDEMIVVATPRELMDAGYLVEPRVFTLPPSKLPNLSGVAVKRGDYAEKDLADAVDRHALVGNIVEHWQAHAAGTRTIAFAVSVAHSRHITERFREAGVSAEHLDGTAPAVERDAVLRRLATGETLVVSNCSLFGEGWDEPSVKCAILARPTKSTGLYLQQAGRILRPFEGQGAVLLDHAGCAVAHGLPQDERTYSLEREVRPSSSTRAGAAPVRVCDSCFAVLPIAARRCELCGAEFAKRELPDEAEGHLVEVSPGAMPFGEATTVSPSASPVSRKPSVPKRTRSNALVDRVLRESVATGRTLSWSDFAQDV